MSWADCLETYEACYCALDVGHESPHRCDHGVSWLVAANGNKVVTEWVGTPPA